MRASRLSGLLGRSIGSRSLLGFDRFVGPIVDWSSGYSGTGTDHSDSGRLVFSGDGCGS